MAGKTITLRALKARADAQVPPRLGLRILAVFALLQLLLLAALLLLFASPAGAASVKGEIAVSTAGGYARLIFTLSEDTDAEVRLNNGILIVAFKNPVDISVDNVALGAPGYVGAARRDPDGRGVRLALNRKVTVNSMAAGEKLFVDLLPEGWTGLPPGLPQEVVEDLARRARDAEKTARQKLIGAQQRALPPLRVRVGLQPTFARYTFPLPGLVSVSADRADDQMTFRFGAPIKIDLADAQVALPPTIATIDTQGEADSATVRFVFVGKVDVRTFREDNNYVIDVLPIAVRGESAASPDKPEPPAQPRADNTPAPPPARPVELKLPETERSPEKPAAAKTPEPSARDAKISEAKPPELKTSERKAPEIKSPEVKTPVPRTAGHKTADAEPADAVRSVEPTPQQPVAPAAGVAASKPVEPRAPPPVLSGPPASVPAHESNEEKVATPSDAASPVLVEVRRQGEALRLTFPFVVPTSAAVFRRADTIWLVFDSQAPIDINKITAQSGRTIINASVTRSREGQVIQLKLDKPKLTSVGADGLTWTVVVGDMILEPTQPLSVVRIVQAGGRASLTIPFDRPAHLHRIADEDVGDTLLVVTALPPARGFLKPQEFVEFNALVSTQGVVIQPRADDLSAEVTSDKIVITRPGGLVLSSAGARASTPGPAREADGVRQPAAGLFVLDPQSWGFDRESDFQERQSQLVAAAAAAPDAKRTQARLNLARFYLSRDLVPEAMGVLDVIAADEQATTDATTLLLRAIANVLMGRGADAMKDLSNAALANRSDAALWRSLALVQQGKWADAREGFRSLDTTTATLPVELQRFAFTEAVRAAVEVRDFGQAQSLLNEFETLGPAQRREAELSVLKGRVMEGLGRLAEASTLYRAATDSPERPVAVRARLREIALRQSIGDMNRDEATAALESLTTSWRGDETETEALQLLSRLYVEENRYRDAFQVMRTALVVYPLSEVTRHIQDEAAGAFERLFLGGKSATMAPIDALSLFYDFRDLTPIGRRGDEMIRKLADRLVSVDLLDQAAELLQHQVDNRLQGAARAQVASRLAVIYLMGRKPDRAIKALRSSRSADLPNEMRNQRLLIEARAQSDVGRPELALEVIAEMQGQEVERLRADVLWKARRWRDAAEQIEKIYGERWSKFEPLTEQERADVLRAAVGYALAEDAIGLDRLRTKYAPKMAEGPDRQAFEVVTAPSNNSAPEFGAVAKVVAGADTLDAFLQGIKARYPDPPAAAPASPVPPAAPANPAAKGAGASAATRRAS